MSFLAFSEVGVVWSVCVYVYVEKYRRVYKASKQRRYVNATCKSHMTNKYIE